MDKSARSRHPSGMIAHADTYKFSVDELNRLVETGIFDEDDRFELLNGEVILALARFPERCVEVSEIIP